MAFAFHAPKKMPALERLLSPPEKAERRTARQQMSFLKALTERCAGKKG